MSTQPDEVDSRRLHNELDHVIKSINRDMIGTATGGVNREDFTNVARMVACLRARYLHSVLRLGTACGNEGIDTEAALELKTLREAYSEAMAGFSALEHALKRGYITLEA